MSLNETERQQVLNRIARDQERRRRLESHGPYREWSPEDGRVWACDRCGALVVDVVVHEDAIHPDVDLYPQEEPGGSR